ncbi:MAG: hypothetical protein M1830_009913 [Pleopsidium flavum]|nr:MAG: hypothetical protein M1830_009913 [Pleopsidium flavum]
MPPPAPPVALKDHCSVINDNTLYVYSPEAFQSLPLEEGGKWTQLAMGTSVTGASCVQAFPNGDGSKATLYIVGGSANPSTTKYSGLQRYSFSDKKWEDITPLVSVTKDRHKHAATYLNSSSSILIYAGSQNGDSLPSSQTFAISTNPPYNVRAFSSEAPPVLEPTLVPWNGSHAAMLGGDAQNKRIYTFSPNNGWQALNVILTDGLKDRSKVQCSLVNGNDGSKVLETYDLTTSPNTVTRTALLDANDQPARSGERIGDPTSSSSSSSSTDPPPAKRRKRNLALSGWPPYNGTLAPKTTRTGFSLAQDSRGLIVISGGNDQDPLSMFDQRGNQWINVTKFFGEKDSQQTPGSKPSPSTSPAASSTANASASSSAAGSVDGANIAKTRSLTILGATLGAIFGLVAILICLLLLLRWIRRRKEAQHRQRSGGFPADQKDRLSFADQGASFMSEAGGSLGVGRNPIDSTYSGSSLAIISGTAGGGHHKPTFLKESSNDSSSSSKDRTHPAPISRPQNSAGTKPNSFALGDERPAVGATRTQPRPDAGWSRYFSGNSVTNLVNIESGRSIYLSQSQDSQSDYSGSRVQSSNPHESAEVPPLSFGGQPLNRVHRSSPTYSHSASDTRDTGLAMSEGMAAQLSRPGSSSSLFSLNERDDAFSSGISSSIHEETTWTPVGTHEYDGRPSSSVYTESTHARDMKIPSFPFPVVRDWERDSAATRWAPNNTVTPFPRRGDGVTVTNVEDYERRRRRPEEHSDMSWLNLGGGKV